MGEPYVTYPGSTGRSASCASPNIVDADSAHLEQSIGKWEDAGVLLGSFTTVSTLTPVFGSKHGKVDVATAGKPVFRCGTGALADAYPVAGSTQYSVSVAVALSVAADARVWLREHVGTTDLGNSAFGTWTALTVGSWTVITLTATTRATTDNVEIRIGIRGSGDVNLAIGDLIYFDTPCLRLGADSAFVPSHNIVSKASIKGLVSLDDYTAAAAQVIVDTLVSNKGLRLGVTTAGELKARYGDGTTDNTGVSSGAAFTDGTEYEIAATIDPTVGTWDFYKDSASFDTDAIGAFTPSPGGGELAVAAAVGGASLNATGKFKWVELIDGDLTGLVVARFDARQVLAAVS